MNKHRQKPQTKPLLPGLAARMAAVRLLGAVIDRRTPLDGLTDDAHGHPHYRALEPRDRALVRAILLTALRKRLTISSIIAARLERPLPAGARALDHLLHVALAQIIWLDIPESAAVNLAVEHAKTDPRMRRFARLVNAVLRGIDPAGHVESGNTADLPPWFAKRMTAAWGADEVGRMANLMAVPAPVDFTVKADAASWAEKLGGMVLPTGGVRVVRPEKAIADLPGYEEGAWWVQDAAASLPAMLMGDLHGCRVADLCAAPGGKTAQLIHAGATVTAIDLSQNRLNRLAANLQRLGMAAELVATDLFDYAPAEPFDTVLLDAPCSSTGTVRRHPDIPWTKTPDDIDKLAGLQARMLAHAVTLVRPGGIVVFANCSLDPAEGEELLTDFLARRDDVALEDAAGFLPPALAFAVRSPGYLRSLISSLDLGAPERSGMDGFFAARLRRLR